MNKEEILKKYRAAEQDEGKEQVNAQADTQGFYAMVGMAFVLMMYQILQDLPFGDIPALLFAFLTVGCVNRYRRMRNRGVALFGLINGFLCVVFLCWYMIQTIM